MTTREQAAPSGQPGNRRRATHGNDASRWSHYLRTLLVVFTYRPERHYMRGNRHVGTATGNATPLPG